MEEKKCKKCGQLLTESNYFEIPEMNEKARKRIKALFGKDDYCNDCTWPHHQEF
ncbi:hypothetical protein OAO34_00660 [Candidatus Poseidoniaceae archaeon]|nr:hypothetical protein [Candidatus Poseidoniaceae archaeon]